MPRRSGAKDIQPRLELSPMLKRNILMHLRCHPALYDTSHPDYKNLEKKDKLLKEFASTFDMEGKGRH